MRVYEFVCVCARAFAVVVSCKNDVVFWEMIQSYSPAVGHMGHDTRCGYGCMHGCACAVSLGCKVGVVWEMQH